jgi:hypothetical protein
MANQKARRFLSLLLISALLFVLIAMQASAFAYYVSTLNNTITKTESASFRLLIRNTLSYDDFFTISTKDVEWLLGSEPISAFVPAGEQVEFVIQLTPKPSVEEGRTYFIPVKIRSEKTGFYFEEREKFAVYVVNPSLKAGVYMPTVTPKVTIDRTIDPRQKVSVNLNLNNRNPRDLPDLKVVVNGEIFYKEYTTHLLPNEDKTNEILFEIDPLTEPGTRTLTLEISFEDKNIGESLSQYDVLGYVDLKKTSSKNTVLFRTREDYGIYNNGNMPGIGEQKFRINIFKRLFTKLSPDADKEKGSDGKSYYVITKELGPQERIDITVITNYRLLVLIIILIILIVVLYYALRSPAILVKNAEPLGKTEGEMSEIKIRLYLKNRSRKPLTNLRVIDVVPSIAEIDKKTHLGSMEPVSIGKSKRGTVPRWEMDVLEPYEERIITYRIKSKLTLIGGIRLPSAKVTFDAGKGKERTTYSNSINLVYKAK